MLSPHRAETRPAAMCRYVRVCLRACALSDLCPISRSFGGNSAMPAKKVGWEHASTHRTTCAICNCGNHLIALRIFAGMSQPSSCRRRRVCAASARGRAYPPPTRDNLCAHDLHAAAHAHAATEARTQICDIGSEGRK